MSDISRAVQTLRRFALRHRDAVEDFPWGDRTIKVRGKIFLFLGQDGETLNLSVKLPQSAEAALALPFTSPTRYRLGRSGWVTARFSEGPRHSARHVSRVDRGKLSSGRAKEPGQRLSGGRGTRPWIISNPV